MSTRPDIETITGELVEAREAFQSHGLERTRAALRGGAALVDLKAVLPHGDFTAHIIAHGYKPKTAQNWMRLHASALSAEEIQERGGIRKTLDSLRSLEAPVPSGRYITSSVIFSDSGGGAETDDPPHIICAGHDDVTDAELWRHRPIMPLLGEFRIVRRLEVSLPGTMSIQGPPHSTTGHERGDLEIMVTCESYDRVKQLAGLLPAGTLLEIDVDPDYVIVGTVKSLHFHLTNYFRVLLQDWLIDGVFVEGDRALLYALGGDAEPGANRADSHCPDDTVAGDEPEAREESARRAYPSPATPAPPPAPAPAPPRPQVLSVRRCVDCPDTARSGADRCRPCEARASSAYDQAMREVQQLKAGQQGLLRQINHLAGQVRDLRRRLGERDGL